MIRSAPNNIAGALGRPLPLLGASQELKNDYVLIFAGGVLPTAFLEKAGVQVKTMKGEAYAPANR